jgi:hypothetical protein
MPTKKDQLLGKSRALIEGRKITSLSDFQATPTASVVPEKSQSGENTDLATQSPEVAMIVNATLPSDRQTTTYNDVQRHAKVAIKVVRENFRFTETLGNALERYATEKRLKKNTIVEIALEQYLRQEGYL